MRLRNKESKIANENFIDYRHKIAGVVDVFLCHIERRFSGVGKHIHRSRVFIEFPFNFFERGAYDDRTAAWTGIGIRRGEQVIDQGVHLLL